MLPIVEHIKRLTNRVIIIIWLNIQNDTSDLNPLRLQNYLNGLHFSFPRYYIIIGFFR